jgi:hypothetical protein
MMTPISSVIEVVQYGRWFFARCQTCQPARNVSPRDRATPERAAEDAREHARTHLAGTA